MQFRDLGKQYHILKKEIDERIEGVISTSSFILGKPVAELEGKLAEYCGRKHCIGVGNGTDALVLSLRAYDIGRGDAVFVPDFTYIASASCVSLVGATPVFVDIDLNTFNMSPVALKEAIERVKKEEKLNPKAIIPVDLFGLPYDVDTINTIAEANNLLVLEDAAQGFGGLYKKRRACSLGDISATSFFPAKPLGCYGDGGAVFTDDDEVDRRIRSLRAGGKSPTDKYDNREIGYNSRLDTLQAAILLPKFKAFADYELDSVNKVASWYEERLKDSVVTPNIPDDYLSSWAQYTIRLENKKVRDNLQRKLKEEGVPSMVYYPRGMHQQEVFKYMNLSAELYPNAIEATETVLSLPMHPYMGEESVETISNLIKKNI